MPSFDVALAWIIVAPLALITDCLAIIIILHYRSIFHSVDVSLISLLITMATNAWFLVPVPAVLELGGFSWNKGLCTFYTSIFILLRCAQILVLLVLNLYWIASLRVSDRGTMFTSSKSIKLFIGVAWFISVIFALVPVAGGSKLFRIYENSSCKFLPYDVRLGVGIIFIVLCLASATIGMISSLDTLMIFKHMRRAAVTKYNAGRLHLPQASGVAHSSSPVHARYNELNVSSELCRLVVFWTLASIVIDIGPFLVIEMGQVIQAGDRDTLETVVLWLMLLEALLVPHLLWVLSDRYRHAVTYTWKVFVLQDKNAKEEDAAACTLQSYKVKAKPVQPKALRNGVVGHPTNGSVPPSSPQSMVGGQGSFENHEPSSSPGVHVISHHGANSGASRDGYLHSDTVMTTDLDDGMTVLTKVNSPGVMIVRENFSNPSADRVNQNTPSRLPGYVQESYAQRGSSVSSSDAPRVIISDCDLTVKEESGSSTTTSPSRSSLDTPSREAKSVERSSSASSRKEWKERMRKKHLPAIFVNNSVEEEKDVTFYSQNSNEKDNIEMEMRHTSEDDMAVHTVKSSSKENKEKAKKGDSIDDYYYVSSDYHYDCLGDSLPTRGLKHQGTTESEGMSGMYEDEDIDNILDDSVSSEKSNRLEKQAWAEARSQSENSSSSKHSAIVSSATNSSEVIDLDDRTESKDVHEKVFVPRPNPRRRNYRNYLNTPGLIVSSVDEDLSFEDNPENGNAKTPTEQTCASSETKFVANGESVLTESNIITVKEAPHITSTLEDITESVSESDPKECNGEMHSAGAMPDLINVSQNYNQLQTVSDAELQKLKLTALTSASAVEYCDDIISDDGGIDNEAFEKDSASTSVDENTNNTGDEISYERKDKVGDSFITDSGLQQRYVVGTESITTTRDANCDGKESSLENSPVNTDKEVDAPNEDNDEHGDTLPSSRELKQHSFTTNPFLRESFEILALSPEYKSQLNAKSNPFFDNLPAETETMNSFAGSDFEKGKADRPPIPHKTSSLKRPKPVSSLSDRVKPPAKTTQSGAKPPVPIMKPPRFRKETSQPYARHTSSEEELERINFPVEDNLSQSNKVELNYSQMENNDSAFQDQRINDISLGNDSKILDTMETESSGSDHSVVLEPYGKRRPPWLEETSDPPNGRITLGEFPPGESDTDVFHDSSDLSKHSMYGQGSGAFEEYNFNAVRIDDFNSHDFASISGNPSQTMLTVNHDIPVVQYHFDEDTDRGFEEALAVDYLTHNITYNGFGLCFESIKEEPEDCLSESASSVDMVELGPPTFKTQAVVSRPTSRASTTDPSAGSQEESFSGREDLNANTFGDPFLPTERTSADGSEAVSGTPQGNGHTFIPSVPSIPEKDSSYAANGISNHYNDKTGDSKVPFSFSTYQGVNNEGDDIFKALPKANTSEKTSGPSPWLDVQAPVDLDMSFESDFSQHCSDDFLEDSNNSNVSAKGMENSEKSLMNGQAVTFSHEDKSGEGSSVAVPSTVTPVYF